MGRIDGHRRQNREGPLVKKLVELFVLGRRSSSSVLQQPDPFGGQLRQHRLVPAAILGGDQFLRPFGRCAAIG